MGTQTKIAEKIVQKKADYVLAVKGTQNNFTKITACGECCVDYKKRKEKLCGGGIETDGNCEEWAQAKGCLIQKCAREHNVQFCGLCKEFPCEWLVNKIT